MLLGNEANIRMSFSGCLLPQVDDLINFLVLISYRSFLKRERERNCENLCIIQEEGGGRD